MTKSEWTELAAELLHDGHDTDVVADLGSLLCGDDVDVKAETEAVAAKMQAAAETEPEASRDYVGRWVDSDIQVVRIGGQMYALDGWDGQCWARCWQCDGIGSAHNMTSDDRYRVRPVYRGELMDDPAEADMDQIAEWIKIDHYEVDHD